ncbi:hypothetical protein C7K25_10945 [Gulosibacter molinativorax]|uniref:PucR family transcriptional regulator n=3 Tax=Gulosibacter molinativorax TaxID=256821 RepID=A0ABT7CAT7_9MICO|nr:hypothetical protein [Gulosibacter molinativorax]QUY62526.1 Hypotetical protein [Gulosibacter molinativorax]
MASQTDYRRRIENVVRQLRANQGDVARRAADWIARELQSYQSVARDDVIASVRLNLERSAGTLLSGSVPFEEDAENRDTTRKRMDSGVPMADIIRGYRISLTVIYEEFLSLAEASQLSPSEILEASHLLWQLGDWFTAGAAAEYRYNAAHVAVRKALEHAEVVRQVTGGDDWPSGLEDRLRDVGVDLDLSYRVVMRDHLDNELADSMRAANFPRPQASLSADIDGRTVLVWPEHADIDTTEFGEAGRWAVGPLRPLHRLHESTVLAGRILRSLPPDVVGVFSAANRGWRLTLPLDPLTREALVEAYLEPLHPESAGGSEIVQTLETFLTEGRNVRRTAEAMTVHQNTVRYRLDRFEELTGASLRETDVIINLALVLAE